MNINVTYQGTWTTLVKNCGFSEEEAKSIEASYHDLYKVSDEWVQNRLKDAEKNGYVLGAFGLKVRTPLIHQSILNTKKTPSEVQAEARTAGNALGQSWGLLNSRAGSEFMGKVRSSLYRLDIKPVGQIHDAQYFLIKNDPGTILYTNKNVVEATQWNHHPDIYHPEVGLGGEFGIHYPSWAEECSLPNELTYEDLLRIESSYISHLKD